MDRKRNSLNDENDFCSMRALTIPTGTFSRMHTQSIDGHNSVSISQSRETEYRRTIFFINPTVSKGKNPRAITRSSATVLRYSTPALVVAVST